MSRFQIVGSLVLLALVAATATGLARWKHDALAAADAAAAAQPEPVESITVAEAIEQFHRPTTTAIGTVVALRSITLRNELAGTVRAVFLEPGAVVEEGTLLVALDVAVEEAELAAQVADETLAETKLGRLERARAQLGASELDVDRARAERDVARAQVARTRAIIGRKTIRAPFRARVGIADVHPGQYLHEGTELTTLQGVDDAVHVEFDVPQAVAMGLQPGDPVELFTAPGAPAIVAPIVARDARIDPATRNATIRARVEPASSVPAPGASVRVRVPTAAPARAVAVPVSALRRGPDGDHVFVVAADPAGQPRAHLRAVQAGSMVGDLIVLRSGLVPGEQVAASGSFKLLDGSAVAPVAAAVAVASR